MKIKNWEKHRIDVKKNNVIASVFFYNAYNKYMVYMQLQVESKRFSLSN